METRTALVTGAAQGLGHEFAVALACRGYRVAGLDLVLQPETAGKVLDYLELIADVTDENQVRQALQRVVDRFGTLHILVNNAGAYPSSPFEDTTPEDWRRVMRVNLEAPFLGLIGFTRALASALGPCDITVNAIAPSMVRTATAERTVGADGGFEHVRAQQAVPRTQLPSDFVSTLLYVIDEGSGFLTGQTLNVSGGSAYL